MDKLKEIIAAVFELDPSEISMEMTPESIETWDSLSQLTLINDIEEEFEIILEIEEIFSILKIGDVFDLLTKKGVI